VLEIGPQIQRVLIQFSCSNIKAIPAGLTVLESETVETAASRQGLNVLNGSEPAIGPKESVDLLALGRDLLEQGFTPLGGFYQERREKESDRTYHMVRFQWFRSGEDSPNKYQLLHALLHLIGEATWRVRVHQNESANEADGRWISINLEARVPLFDLQGDVILEHIRDEQKKPTGEKRTRQTGGYLRADGGILRIVPEAPVYQ